MINAITMPVLNFYRFYNVPLARQIRREIADSGAKWRRAQVLENMAYHSDLDQANMPGQQDLQTWFQQCLDQVVSADLPPNYGCTVTEMWMTRTEQGQAMHHHSHPLSVYSGVFYLQDSEGSTDFTMSTWFHERWPQMVLPAPMNQSQPQWSSPCREGHLIIFPSHIFHRQRALEQALTRYTVAFNSFWSGQLSDQNSTRLWVRSQYQEPK